MSQHESQLDSLLVHFNQRLTAVAHAQQMMMELIAPHPYWRGFDDWWPLPGEFLLDRPVPAVMPEDVVIPDQQEE